MNELKLVDCSKNGKCTGCGNCCSDILPLSNDEVIQIRAYIKKHKIKEQKNNVMVGNDMICPFRDEVNKKCLIYSIRPAICRQFMCNHTQQDIMSANFDLRKKWAIISMRAEFYEK